MRSYLRCVVALGVWWTCIGSPALASGIGQGKPDPTSPQPQAMRVLGAPIPFQYIVRVAVDPRDSETLGDLNATTLAIRRFSDEAMASGAKQPEVLDPVLGYLGVEIPDAAVAALRGSKNVQEFFEDFPVVANLSAAVPAVKLDRIPYTGSGGLVVVIDSGVERTHPFFGGRVIEEACIGGGPEGCPGPREGPGAAAPCATGCEHGTHVAGIAAGFQSAAFRGGAPTSNIGAIRVLGRLGGDTRDTVKAIEYIRDVWAHRDYVTAVNLSLGVNGDDSYCARNDSLTAFQSLRDAGVAIVAASSNESQAGLKPVRWPACLAPVIAVGSVVRNNATGAYDVSGFSNAGPALDVLAPGENINSSLPGRVSYGLMSGTSMASPLVAGGIAALRSEADWPLASIEAALKASPTRIRDPRNGVTYPMVDFADAVIRLRQQGGPAAKIFIKDNLRDVGGTDGSHLAGSPAWESPDIWVRNQQDGLQRLHAHQNPEFGTPNFLYAQVRNSGGAAQRGRLVFFQSRASTVTDSTTDWLRVGDKHLDVPAYGAGVGEVAWLNLPRVGHYCLLALWVPDGQPENLNLSGGLSAAVSKNPYLVWKNVDIVDVRSKSDFLASLSISAKNGDTVAIEFVRRPEAEGYGIVLTFPPNTQFNHHPSWKVLGANSDGMSIYIPISTGVLYIPGVRPADPSKPMEVRMRTTGPDSDSFAEVATMRLMQLKGPPEGDVRRKVTMGGVTYLLSAGRPEQGGAIASALQ